MPIKAHKFTTPQQLYEWLANTYGTNPWPEAVEVSPLLYARIFQATVDFMIREQKYITHPEHPDVFMISVATGPNKGIMFKNVELILR